jgi:hypothetical protein
MSKSLIWLSSSWCRLICYPRVVFCFFGAWRVGHYRLVIVVFCVSVAAACDWFLRVSDFLLFLNLLRFAEFFGSIWPLPPRWRLISFGPFLVFPLQNSFGPHIYDVVVMYFLFYRSLFVLCKDMVNNMFAVKKSHLYGCFKSNV